MIDRAGDNTWSEIDSHITELAEQRGLARWEAFRDWAFAEIFKGESLSESISETDLAEQYTRIDGPDDFEIDGYFPSDDERVIALFQAKDKPTISRNEVNKFLNAPQQILVPSLVEQCNNVEVKNLHSLLREKIVDEGFGLRLVIATSGRLDKRAEMSVKEFKRNLRLDLHYSDKVISVTVELAIYDWEALAGLFNRRKAERRPARPDVELRLIRNYEFQTGDLKTLSALIPAKDLVDAFRKYQYSLFNENPRLWLGTRARPYIRMGDTLANKQRKAWFHLLNNGLSALCDSYFKVEDLDEGVAKYRFLNFQIVNGCQTTRFLYGNADKVDNTVFVSLKVTQTDNPTLGQQIAEATNTQTGLKAQQFKANNVQQRQLKTEFAHLSPPWFYEIKTGEWAYDTSDKRPFAMGEKKYRYLSMKDVAQATLAFIGMPGEALEDTRTIFENKENVDDNRRHYEDVFPSDIKAEQLLLPSQIKQKISSRIRSLEPALRDPFNYGELYIVWLVGELLRSQCRVEHGFLPNDRSKALNQTINTWFDNLFEVTTEALNDVVEDTKDEEKRRGSTFNQRNFYRNRAGTIIYQSIRARLDRVLQRIRRRSDRSDPLGRLP